jgi:RNA polymerase sigma factor (sigma-70 family)
LYARHRERAVSCGAERSDCLQVCWFAFLDAVEAYNREQERSEKFSSFARFHVRRHIYSLLGLRTSKREPLNEADSADAPIYTDDGEYTIADTLADERAEIPFDDVANADVAREVLGRLDLLSDKMRGIMRRHFWEGRTLTEIAKADGANPKRVHNLYRDALRKLRRDDRLRQIHDEFYANANLTRHTGFKFFKETQTTSVEWHLLKLEERLGRAKGGDES